MSRVLARGYRGAAIDVPSSTDSVTARLYQNGTFRSAWTCGASTVNLALAPTFDQSTSPDHLSIGEIDQVAIGTCCVRGGLALSFSLTQPGSVVATSGLDGSTGQARVEGVGLRAESNLCSFNVAGGADIDTDTDLDAGGRHLHRPSDGVVGFRRHGRLGHVMSGTELRLVGTFTIT